MLFSTAFVALVAAAPALSAPVAITRKSTSTGLTRRALAFIPGNALTGGDVAPPAEDELADVDAGDAEDLAPVEDDQALVDENLDQVDDEVVDDNLEDALVDVNDPEILAQAEAIALEQLTQQINDEQVDLEQQIADIEQQIIDAEGDDQAIADLQAQLDELNNALAINEIQRQLLADNLVVLEQAPPEVDPELQALLDRQAELLAELELLKQQIADLEAAGEDVQQAEDLMAGVEDALAEVDQQVDDAVAEAGLDQDAILAELIAQLQALTDVAAQELVDELNNGGGEAADILALLDTATDDVAAAVDDLVAAAAVDATALNDDAVQNIIDLIAAAELQALDLQTAVANEQGLVEDEVLDNELVEDEVVDDGADVVADPDADLFDQLRQLLEQLRAQQQGIARRRRSLKN